MSGITRERAAKMMQKKTEILFAVSESSKEGYPNPSASSRNAFDWIVHSIIRSNTSGFKLSLLHVHPHDTNTVFQGERNDWYLNHTKGTQLLQYFVNRCTEIGVAYDAFNREGDNPKRVICKEVKRMNPDFLVLGSSRQLSGLGALFRLFVDDVNEYCVKNAKCIVVIAKQDMEMKRNPPSPADQIV